MEKYYKAYNKRYKQVHFQGLQWASENPTPIILEMLEKYKINLNTSILEIGCGEARDAIYLLEKGYQVFATDVSEESIDYCQKKYPYYKDCFGVLDVCTSKINEQFNFIYSIAVIHMLVLQEDRDAFYAFIYRHLKENGIALILTMGDGEIERSSEPLKAYDDVERIHQVTQSPICVATTSCKMINFEHFEEEIVKNHLEIIEKGITSIIPDFPTIMYALVKKQ